MQPLRNDGESYLQRMKDRAQQPHVHREFQEIGLMVAELLQDAPHKALYIKLAKELGTQKILGLAKSVAERREVSNRGAYFMWMLGQEGMKSKNHESMKARKYEAKKSKKESIKFKK